MEYNYCKDCKAFMDPSSGEKDWGECRLNPPQVFHNGGNEDFEFPRVLKYQWCLQFKEKKSAAKQP